MPISLLTESPELFVLWVLAIVFGITVHEFGHALAAFLQGDLTARALGRLTLNPLAHLDPFGFLMLLFAGFGWGKPTPYDPNNLRFRRWGSALVGLAGPAVNLLFLVIFGFAFRLIVQTGHLGEENLLVQFLLLLIVINLVLMLFNLIPVPPLDGSKVLFSLLPAKFDQWKLQLEQRGPLLLLGLIVLDNFLNIGIFSTLFGGAQSLAFRLILG